MQPKSIHTAYRIALISTPWPLYNRPSIQLGTLKAYLRSIYPDIEVEAHHFYLKLAASIGYRQYHEISKRTWLAETVYAALLYPQRLQQIDLTDADSVKPDTGRVTFANWHGPR